jgi:hypothetical protein
MNGTVEPCNDAWRYEFYETYDFPSGVESYAGNWVTV